MTDNLRKGILLKIDDTLETLKLRLMLNKETIIPEDSTSASLQEAIQYYQEIATQNQQAQNVIQECENTIDKLLLLKKQSSVLSLDAIIHFYNNYKEIHLVDFQKQLQGALKVRQSSQ